MSLSMACVSCSCLELLVCVLNLLLASTTFSDQQLQALQQQSPSAIGPDGAFSTLKALSQEAKVEFANTRVSHSGCESHTLGH